MTILVSSHELGEIDGVATHVAFLDEGRLLFQESMNELCGRFREVRVTLVRERPAPALPKDWLQVRNTGNVLTFVDTRFADDHLGERIRAIVGEVRAIDAEPMALRAIFTALARSTRDAAEAARKVS